MPPEYVRYAQSVSCLRAYTAYHADINPAYSNMMTLALLGQVRDFEIAGDMRKRNMGVVDFSHDMVALVRERVADMGHTVLAETLFPVCADDFLKYVGHCAANKEEPLSDQCLARFAEVELSPKKRRTLLREVESVARAGLTSSSSLWGASHSRLSIDSLEGSVQEPVYSL